MKQNQKIAIVIGSTGMVGRELINQLLNDDSFSTVISLSRRSLKIENTKLREHIVDFDIPTNWQELVKGDVLFSTMGTTIKQAKTKDQQYLIDYTYQYEVAKTAATNGVPCYVLVSSAGANANSPAFYMKMKGELEDNVKKLPFNTIHILRPVQLMGSRENNRFSEKIAISLMKFINGIGLLRKYRPISAQQVAEIMIKRSKQENSSIIRLHG